MLKTIKRILKNFEWAILNHPPTGHRSFKEGEEVPVCDYCNSNDYAVYHMEDTKKTICYGCLGKVYDKVLEEGS